jgi:rRNA maturation RNase YbeY
MSELILKNRQQVRKIDLRLLRQIIRSALADDFKLEQFELGIHLVGARDMALINEQFLNHEGSTDVITFDHAEAPAETAVHGEIFICLDDAVAQARAFGTSWQAELVRYVVHGVLHLLGYDDLNPPARRIMKREENRLLKQLAARFAFRKLQRIASSS